MAAARLNPAIPQLPSGDIDRTAAFFEAVLGFTIAATFIEHGHLIVRRELAEIHFWRTENEQQALTIAGQSSCYIRVENVESLFDEFKAAGAPFGYELTNQPWGMREMQVTDPYGNAIRFGEAL